MNRLLFFFGVLLSTPFAGANDQSCLNDLYGVIGSGSTTLVENMREENPENTPLHITISNFDPARATVDFSSRKDKGFMSSRLNIPTTTTKVTDCQGRGRSLIFKVRGIRIIYSGGSWSDGTRSYRTR